jgi:hypothetical protein
MNYDKQKRKTGPLRHRDTKKQMKFLKGSSKPLSKEVLRASVSLWLMFASVFSVVNFAFASE